ncbi:MAG: alkene reductase [Gemmatimonadaceae bacterium]|nr:alkene reductase [Gemmatimonadaceae bacterium]MCU0626857.1 alkene reductase [Gemmatimonadaceae bacterium]
MTDLTTLLSPVTLGALTLPNRVLMAPMTRSRAGADNAVLPITATYYAQRATAGLILTEATAVSPQGVGYPNIPGIFTDAHVEAWRPVVDAVHAAGGRIALQLFHVGRISLPAYQPDGALPVAPSAIAPAGTTLYGPDFTPGTPPVPRALEASEIPAIVAQFAAGARRAKAAGFDAVEIHGASGYLIDQFLRDGANTRTDAYGGSPERRARVLLEITEAVAKEMGADRTGVRVSPENPFNDMRDGDPRATYATVARLLRSFDLAWFEVVRGTPAVTDAIREAYQRPLVLNTGFTAEEAEAAIRADLAVAVSFGAPYIANPDLVERFTQGAPLATPDRATFYGGGEAGYTDYPLLGAVAA